MFKAFKPLDIVLYGLVLAAIIWGVIGFTANQGEASLVYIKASEKTFWYPLDEDREVVVYGPVGETHIHIHDGQVTVVESDCRDKLCIAAGAIDSPGQWNACLPNAVFIEIQSSKKAEIDGLGY